MNQERRRDHPSIPTAVPAPGPSGMDHPSPLLIQYACLQMHGITCVAVHVLHRHGLSPRVRHAGVLHRCARALLPLTLLIFQVNAELDIPEAKWQTAIPEVRFVSFSGGRVTRSVCRTSSWKSW